MEIALMENDVFYLERDFSITITATALLLHTQKIASVADHHLSLLLRTEQKGMLDVVAL
jgi:hypothetical protein